MKQIRYRGIDFTVRFLIEETSYLGMQKEPFLRYRFIIDPWTIEVMPCVKPYDHGLFRGDLDDIFGWKPPIEIFHYENRSVDFYFWKNGHVVSEIDFGKTVNAHMTEEEFLWPEFVGFFKLPPDWSREEYLYGFPCFEFLYIPIPIKCTVRDMNAEEKLILNHYETMPKEEHAREDERMEKDRKKLIQKLQAKAGLTLKEALAEFMKFDLPGVSTDTRARIKEAVMLYSQPEFHSLSKVANEFNVTPKTVSTWLKTFTDKTGFQVVQFQKHQSIRAQAEVKSLTGGKHIPKRLSSDM